MKKELAFFTKNLDIGGIERAVINYVNNIDKTKYNVTLFLEKKEGIYLDNINKDIKIIDISISNHKNILLRKFINAYKLLSFSIKYYHKFDFACSFATYLKSGNILAKRFASNNAIWFHGEYWSNSYEANRFLKYTKALKYQKVVFVSNHAKDKYLEVRPNTKQKLYVLNNMINGEEIIAKSKIDLNLKKTSKIILNVGRHEEESKRLSVLINACHKLINEGYDFNLWLVGDGVDHNKYIDLVKKLKLNKYVTFFGKQSNVYPYYAKCDVVVLSSKMEGNPVVYLEAKVLNKPVISTDIADAKIELAEYGIVVPYGIDGLYNGLKKFLDNGYIIKRKFDSKKYNQNILTKLYEIIEN